MYLSTAPYTQLIQETNCKIWHSHSGAAQDSSLPGCDTLLGEQFTRL